MFTFKKITEKDINEDYISLMSQLSNTLSTDINKLKTFFKNNIENNNNIIQYIFRKNNENVGLITIIIEPKFIHDCSFVGHIEDVIIDKKFRGYGYGKKLIEFAINECKIKNCYKVILDCNKKNINFYKKTGFIKTEYQMRYNFD